MMIESLHTHITVITVSGPWRPEYEASVAEFNFLSIGFHGYCIVNGLVIADRAIHILLTDGDIFIKRVFKGPKYFGDDARIRKRKKHQKYIAEQMKDNTEQDQIPALWVRSKDVEEYHPNV